MRTFRLVMLLLVLLCLAPLASVALAALLANSHGCTLHEGFANPCVIAGRDMGSALYAMGVAGWLMLLTLPLAVLAAGAWIVIEVIALVRRRRRQA